MANSSSATEQQAHSQHPYTPTGQTWERNSYFAPVPGSSPVTTDGPLDAASAASGQPAISPGAPFATYDYLPLFLSQQPNVYQAQLLHYNKLISPSRGGGGLQTPPLPPVVSSSTAHAGTRSRSSSKVSLKDAASAKNSSGGHGGRSNQNSDKNRAVIASKEVPHKMGGKHQNGDSSKAPTSRSAPTLSTHVPAYSASVPSTPHQHARKFSFESREPSPNAANSHSPRSAYSESGATAPSTLKLGPPRNNGCKYETAQQHQRRRIPYSIGDAPLERLDLRTVKDNPSPEEEAKLATDMREVYDRLLPTAEVEDSRKQLVQKLETILNEEWPGHDILVHLFGSSGNFLCSDDSDVDICITTEWKELEKVCMIADLLARKGFEKVVCISGAKVPIVKVWDPVLNLACDMNVNNTAALENTRMIRTYVEIDSRVRQLAMMVKYWSRRRIVNDAAFGGTLSSYTWICLIIAFLQLRNPPVLPALHQLPYKLQQKSGKPSEFADNLKRLKGFGNDNKSSAAQLLFQFFRFYAHEFEYDKYVLSVRHGRLMTKEEKGWQYGVNNKLCVEEPFTTTRNLGNTADEFSFRGLHLELRRAFDLLSIGQFAEACEPYEFPEKEEPKPAIFQRAPPPKPVLMRSASQTNSGRGGRGNHRGGRHNNGYRGNNSNRRASSSIAQFDPNVMMPQGNMQQADLSWYYHTYYPYLQQDLMTQMWPSQEHMRQQLQQMYGQQAAAAMAQQHASINSQRGGASASNGQQTNDRSRTNSFDNAPMSAPVMRPDAYAAAMYAGMQGFVPQAGVAYPNYMQGQMLNTSSSQDFRRGSQRSTMATESGNSGSSSSLRSQSQPAARPQNQAYNTTGYAMGQSVPGSGAYHAISTQGTMMSDFVPNEDETETTPKGKVSTSDPSATLAVPDASTSPQGSSEAASANASPLANGTSAASEVNTTSSSRRRRLSTDQLPQTILDRRMRRTSRSPSPMGHTRAISVGAGPTPLSGQPLSVAPNVSSGGPLVVNGSSAGRGNGAYRQQPVAQPETVPTGFDNPLHLNMGQAMGDVPQHASTRVPLVHNPVVPMMANGANHLMPSTSQAPMPIADDTSFRERIAMLSLQAHGNGLGATDTANGSADSLSASARQRLTSRQQQSGAIAPLDLAISGENFKQAPDTALLSPVYETRTPSPTVIRSEYLSKNDAMVTATEGKSEQSKLTSAPNKPSPLAQRPTNQNGHTRGAKSENDSSWQKAGKGKRKGGNHNSQQSGHPEPQPKNAAERRGG